MQTTQFIAVVEVATRVGVRPEASATLAEYSPEITVSERGWVQVSLTITASGLAHACATAAAMARVATGAEAIACHVMTAQEHGVRHYAGRHAGTGPARGPENPTGLPAKLPVQRLGYGGA